MNPRLTDPAAPPIPLPARARELSATITTYLDRLDAIAADPDPDGLSVYGRREIHAGVTRIMRREGVGLLGELAGEVERLATMVEERAAESADREERWARVPAGGRPLDDATRRRMNLACGWDGDGDYDD